MKKMHTFTTPDGTTYEIADQYAREKIENLTVEAGESGATFTPSVAEDGTLSWTNDKGLANPAPVNITGPAGPQGPQGEQGDTGAVGPQGLSVVKVTLERTDMTDDIVGASIVKM